MECSAAQKFVHADVIACVHWLDVSSADSEALADFLLSFCRTPVSPERHSAGGRPELARLHEAALLRAHGHHHMGGRRGRPGPGADVATRLRHRRACFRFIAGSPGADVGRSSASISCCPGANAIHRGSLECPSYPGSTAYCPLIPYSTLCSLEVRSVSGLLRRRTSSKRAASKCSRAAGSFC